MKFWSEGRFFPSSLFAFTFAQIQADRMNRPVEVHMNHEKGFGRTWHATAHPSDFVRSHLVKQPPGPLPVALAAVA